METNQRHFISGIFVLTSILFITCLLFFITSAVGQTGPVTNKTVAITFQSNFQPEDAENIKQIIVTDKAYGVADFVSDPANKKITLRIVDDALVIRRLAKLLKDMGYVTSWNMNAPFVPATGAGNKEREK